MPFAVALLNHAAGTYAFLVFAVAGLTYGLRARRFVPAFAGGSAGLLAILGLLHIRPSGMGLALIATGVVLLHVELLVATRGLAGVLGLAAVVFGSWATLGVGPSPLSPPWRLLLATVGAGTLLVAVVRATRRANPPS